MASNLSLDLRQAIGKLGRKIAELMPGVRGCADGAQAINELSNRRSLPQLEFGPPEHAERLAAELQGLTEEIERRFEPFRKVELGIRTAASELEEILLEIPASQEQLRLIAIELQAVQLRAAVRSNFRLSMKQALRDLERIHFLLDELLDRQERPTPASVIDRLREEMGLSMEELAAKANLNPKQLYAVKNRQNPTAKTIRAVADALGCDPADLI